MKTLNERMSEISEVTTSDEKLGAQQLPALAAELTAAGFKVKQSANDVRFHRPANRWWMFLFHAYRPFRVTALGATRFILTPMWPYAHPAWAFDGTREGLIEFLAERFSRSTRE